MIELSKQERAKLRKVLLTNGVSTRGLNDEELQARAADIAPAPDYVPENDVDQNWEITPANDVPAEVAPASVADAPAPSLGGMLGAMEQAIQIAIQTALNDYQPPAPDFDEDSLIALIKTHATQTLNITVKPRPDMPEVNIDMAHEMLPKIFDLITKRLHVYMAGDAGSGKTTIMRQCAEMAGLDAYIMSSVKAPHDLTGHMKASGEYHRTPFRDAFEHGGVLGFDEIDNSSAQALVVVNGAIANSHFAFPDKIVERHPDFVCIAGANTSGRGATRLYVGRESLDAASLDRFFNVFVDYDLNLETQITMSVYQQNGGTDNNVAHRWLETVRQYRAEVNNRGWKVIVSPRASIQGVTVLADPNSPITHDDLLEGLIFRHLSADQRAALEV